MCVVVAGGRCWVCPCVLGLVMRAACVGGVVRSILDVALHGYVLEDCAAQILQCLWWCFQQVGQGIQGLPAVRHTVC